MSASFQSLVFRAAPCDIFFLHINLTVDLSKGEFHPIIRFYVTRVDLVQSKGIYFHIMFTRYFRHAFLLRLLKSRKLSYSIYFPQLEKNYILLLDGNVYVRADFS